MVDAEYRLGLYIAIPLYFAFIVACTVWSYFYMKRLESDGKTDHLSAHYLGGRSFGPLITAGTIFASFFSGYTVVGVVNEAYNTGWQSLRWMPAEACVAAGYAMTGIRLRKASMFRNHQSPVDFITDRYHSQLLRYVVLTLQVLSCLIYVSAQVVSLKGTFNTMFGINPDSPWSAVIMLGLILGFEWAGGLTSVALTDCVQGFVMTLSFIMIAIVVNKNFGGWSDLDPTTYPKPQLYQTPTSDQQWVFWQFYMSLISMFALPHFMQRVYAARDLKSLKFAWTVMTVAPWFTILVSIFLGTVGVQMFDGEPAPSDPYAGIIEKVMSLGGFPQAVGILTYTSSLAAIMSTTDSLIIAISQLVTVEIIYPLIPHATPSDMGRATKIVSLVSVSVSLLFGLFWSDGISLLGAIQFSIQLMSVPAFFWGLYASDKYDVHPWSIAIGAIVSTLYVILIFFMHIRRHSNPKPIDAGMTGLVFQIGLILLLEVLRRLRNKPYSHLNTKHPEADGVLIQYPGRPKWDIPSLKRFGDVPLTPHLLGKSMEGVAEPIRNLWCVFAFLLALTIVTPLVPGNMPPLSDDGMFSDGWLPAVVNGLPWWAFKIIILNFIPYAMVLLAISTIPDQFPMETLHIVQKGTDPSIVHLTIKEFANRSCYDSCNKLLQERRSSISKCLCDLGIKDESLKGTCCEETCKPTDAQIRLTALIKGETYLANDDEEISSKRQ